MLTFRLRTSVADLLNAALRWGRDVNAWAAFGARSCVCVMVVCILCVLLVCQPHARDAELQSEAIQTAINQSNSAAMHNAQMADRCWTGVAWQAGSPRPPQEALRRERSSQMTTSMHALHGACTVRYARMRVPPFLSLCSASTQCKHGQAAATVAVSYMNR
jgi:hypothetical protein